ncbi:hypothetical protein QBC43DRAFT_316677 [Cladorrhinum sp. PSN259]|nr:hypothetical protein QBC43DRAFT_316677 [Cladorrhinum sp. PSN259]
MQCRFIFVCWFLGLCEVFLVVCLKGVDAVFLYWSSPACIINIYNDAQRPLYTTKRSTCNLTPTHRIFVQREKNGKQKMWKYIPKNKNHSNN